VVLEGVGGDIDEAIGILEGMRKKNKLFEIAPEFQNNEVDEVSDK